MAYRVLHCEFKKAKQYMLRDSFFFDDDVEICKDLKASSTRPRPIMLSGEEVNEAKNKKYEDSYNLTKVYGEGHYDFNLVNS